MTIVACVFVLLVFAVSCSVLRWNDCRKVGHAWWYCVSEISR